jgi:Common central domain of tyrosinase
MKPGSRRTRKGHISRRGLFGLAAAVATAVALRADRIQAGASPQVRRNAKTLNSAERHRLVEAIMATKGMPSLYDPSMNAYDYWVNLHYDAYYNKSMPAHMAPAFGPWHRWFTLLFEQDLQRIDPTLTIPYWDWTADQGPDAYIWGDDLMGGEGDPNDNWIVKTGPFRQGNWRISVIDPASLDQDGTIHDLQRHFGVYISGGEPQTHLPTAADVAGRWPSLSTTSSRGMTAATTRRAFATTSKAFDARRRAEGFRRRRTIASTTTSADRCRKAPRPTTRSSTCTTLSST